MYYTLHTGPVYTVKCTLLLTLVYSVACRYNNFYVVNSTITLKKSKKDRKKEKHVQVDSLMLHEGLVARKSENLATATSEW